MKYYKDILYTYQQWNLTLGLVLGGYFIICTVYIIFKLHKVLVRRNYIEIALFNIAIISQNVENYILVQMGDHEYLRLEDLVLPL
jgi:hypothetical protein